MSVGFAWKNLRTKTRTNFSLYIFHGQIFHPIFFSDKSTDKFFDINFHKKGLRLAQNTPILGTQIQNLVTKKNWIQKRWKMPLLGDFGRHTHPRHFSLLRLFVHKKYRTKNFSVDLSICPWTKFSRTNGQGQTKRHRQGHGYPCYTYDNVLN